MSKGIHLDELDPDTKRRVLKVADPATRKHAQTIDQEQARRLASKLMQALCADADQKTTQRKALDLCRKWLAVR